MLMKKRGSAPRRPVIERNRPGRHVRVRRGVLGCRRWPALPRPTREAYREIAQHLVHWDDIDVHYRGERDHVHRPRLQRHEPSHAARDAAAAGVRRRRGSLSSSARCQPRRVRRRRSHRRRRRRQQHGAPDCCRTRLRSTIDMRPEPLRLARHDASRFPRSPSISSTTVTASGACTRISTRRTARRSSSNAARKRGGPRAWTARPRRKRSRFSRHCSPRSSRATG